jgi:WhiB family redox-sensing transcriptional regulator
MSVSGVRSLRALRDSAACRGADPELCLTWALQHAMSEGIWGGSTETERRAIVADLNGRRAFLGRASRVQSGTGGQWP